MNIYVKNVVSNSMNVCIITFIICMFISGNLFSQDWPGWRGSNANSTVTGSDLFAIDNARQLEVIWKKPLGPGYSAISVVGNYAVTMFADKTHNYLIALKADSGEEHWRYAIDSVFVGRFGSQDGPLSTPLIDGNRVYGLSPRGLLFSLDLTSGEENWQIDLVESVQARQPFYGFATAPIVYENLLIIAAGGADGNALLALDKMSGEKVWAAGDSQIRYQTPVITEINGEQLLLGPSREFLYAVQPAEGKMSWAYEHLGNAGDTGGGSINPILLPDNRVYLKYKHSESVMLRMVIDDAGTNPEILWTSRGIKNTYSVPVYWDGFIYSYSGAFLTCIDASDGKVQWKSRTPGDGFPIIADGHLVIQTKKGRLSVGKASPDGFEEMSGAEVFSDLAWNAPSVANGRIFTRSHGEIAALGFSGTEVAENNIKENTRKIEGTAFAAFLQSLESESDKTETINAFLAAQPTLPIVENDSIVYFIYHGEADEMAITGEPFGYEGTAAMTHVPGTNLFYYSMVVPPNASFGYGFMINFQDAIKDPFNKATTRVAFMGEMSLLTMPGWKVPAHLSEYQGNKAGQVEQLIVKSELREEEITLDVYLPHGYNADDREYPVVYYHGEQQPGNLVNTLNQLIDVDLPPMVVVFIPRLWRSGYGTYVGRDRDKYRQVFIEDILPAVEGKYRLQAGREHRANLGVFYSGFMAFYLTFNHPDLFGIFAAQSPYWDPDEARKHQAIIDAAREDINIYVDWGKYATKAPQEGWDFGEYTRTMVEQLTSAGFQCQGGEVNEGAGWASWQNRTDLMFKMMFPATDN